MVSEWWIAKRVEGSDLGPIWGLYHHLPIGTEKYHERPQSRWPYPRPRFEPRISLIRSKSVALLKAMFDHVGLHQTYAEFRQRTVYDIILVYSEGEAELLSDIEENHLRSCQREILLSYTEYWNMGSSLIKSPAATARQSHPWVDGLLQIGLLLAAQLGLMCG